VKNIYQSFTHKMAAKASWHRNYVTVTLCTLAGRLAKYGTAVIDVATRNNSETIDANFCGL